MAIYDGTSFVKYVLTAKIGPRNVKTKHLVAHRILLASLSASKRLLLICGLSTQRSSLSFSRPNQYWMLYRKLSKRTR